MCREGRGCGVAQPQRVRACGLRDGSGLLISGVREVVVVRRLGRYHLVLQAGGSRGGGSGGWAREAEAQAGGDSLVSALAVSSSADSRIGVWDGGSGR